MTTPAQQPRLRLSPAARTIARRAVVRAPGWADYASTRNMTSAALSGEILFAAADALGVDVAAVVKEAAAQSRANGGAAFGNIGSGNTPAAAPTALDELKIRAIARAVAKDEINLKLTPVIKEVVVAVNMANGSRVSLSETTHPQFAKLAQAVSVRDFSGNALNIFLVGPTGTGKSYACRQLAKLLGCDFQFQSLASEGFDLVGYEKPNGVMKITPFVKAFRDGGVCLLDEVDRYDAKATVALNAALANGEITLDNGETVKRHKDFICVASGNTFGFGGDANFTAAEKMDLSTISRFPVRIDWFICPKAEDAIAAAKAADADVAAAWIVEIRAVREAMDRLGLPFLADQRCIEAGAQLLAAGMSPADTRNLTYLAGLSDDQQTAILNSVGSRLVINRQT